MGNKISHFNKLCQLIFCTWGYFEHLNSHPSGNWSTCEQKHECFYKQAAKAKSSIPKMIVSLEALTLLVAGTMWMSGSSHTCPSGSNSILMMALTGGRLVAIATAHYLKEILLCCGGVCEGHQPDQMWLQEQEQHSRLPDTHRGTTDTHTHTLRPTVSHRSGKQTLRCCFYRNKNRICQ